METFQFSVINSASAIAYSPGSTFIATATGSTLLVRSAKTLQAVRHWECVAEEVSSAFVIDDIKWSSNGSRLLASSKSSSCTWVLDLSCPSPIARIDGPHTEAAWGVDDVLIWSDASLSMYRVDQGIAKLVQQVQSSKHAFSPDSRYIVVPESHSGKEFLAIYDNASLVQHFPAHVTEAECLTWSPCGKWIAVADWKLCYSVLVYSPVGTKVGEYRRPSSVSGVKQVSWSPNGRHLAVGGYDGAVRVLESESWQPILVVRGFENGALVESRVSNSEEVVHFQHVVAPHNIGSAEVEQLGFSNDGKLMYFTQGCALHVYDFLPEPSAASPDISHRTSVLFNRHINDIRICPTTNRLLVVNGSSVVYFWDVHGVQGVQIPEGRQFHPNNAVWAPDGKKVALCDHRSFCVVYEDLAGEAGEQWEEEE